MLSLPAAWSPALAEFTDGAGYGELLSKVTAERAACAVFPPEPETYRALELTAPEQVRVVILGQDPYHEEFQAHGLAFSVPEGVKIPPSLRNIYKELADEYKWPRTPASGDLRGWAEQGVLLLNTVLTVRAHEANSHRKIGWERFTDAVIRAVNRQPERVVFLLWGAPAQRKRPLIDETRHAVLETAHPSPLSAYRGFLGSGVFLKTNELLVAAGRRPVDWARCGAASGA